MKYRHQIPFEKGKWYKTKCEISGILENLPKGIELEYDYSSHSIYDSKIGFFFKDINGEFRRWDIDDNSNPVEEAKKVFELTGNFDI